MLGVCVWLGWGGAEGVWLLSVEDRAVEAVLAFGVGPEISSGLSLSGGGGLLLGLVVLGTYTNWMCLLHMAQ